MTTRVREEKKKRNSLCVEGAVIRTVNHVVCDGMNNPLEQENGVSQTYRI
jgi:hypothetical protein